MYKKNKGFTLIELLVVIAIIAVLSGVVVTALNPLQRLAESRDSRRQQDIQAVRQALDLALTDGEVDLQGSSGTQATGNSNSDGTAVDGTGWVKVTTTGDDGLKKYIPVLPSDPADTPPGDGNGFEFVSDGQYYELKVEFETEKYESDIAANDGGNEAEEYEIGTNPGLTF